ncbi:hypothetical protein [Bacillus massilinigeriensis]|uniref:hypothetical protein n=1 Tax=Bacillus massilionigeriensis TaxID=1805475 RepID=UPI00096AFBB9|nr:hypothetical protein [Bacillus massilionigeriensis]
MSLKTIELQIALPRTLEAGKLQEQLQQQGTIMQEHAGQSVKKEEEKQRTTVLKSDLKEIRPTLEDEGGKNSYHDGKRQRRKKEDHHKKENHPYKGTNIDYSG